MAQTVKHLSTIQETQVRSLGREDPLEKEMPMHSSTIAWKSPWTEEPGRLQSMGSHTPIYIYIYIYIYIHIILYILVCICYSQIPHLSSSLHLSPMVIMFFFFLYL